MDAFGSKSTVFTTPLTRTENVAACATLFVLSHFRCATYRLMLTVVPAGTGKVHADGAFAAYSRAELKRPIGTYAGTVAAAPCAGGLGQVRTLPLTSRFGVAVWVSPIQSGPPSVAGM